MSSKIGNAIERRSINIPKDDFDMIKEFCDMKALNMVKWMILLAKREMNKIEGDK